MSRRDTPAPRRDPPPPGWARKFFICPGDPLVGRDRHPDYADHREPNGRCHDCNVYASHVLAERRGDPTVAEHHAQRRAVVSGLGAQARAAMAPDPVARLQLTPPAREPGDDDEDVPF